jgi:hypothetical protein
VVERACQDTGFVAGVLEARHPSQWGARDAAAVARRLRLGSDEEAAVCEALTVHPHLPPNLRHLEWSERSRQLRAALAELEKQQRQSDDAISHLVKSQCAEGLSEDELDALVASYDSRQREQAQAAHQYQRRTTKQWLRQQRKQRIAALEREIQHHASAEPDAPKPPPHAVDDPLQWRSLLLFALWQQASSADATNSARAQLAAASVGLNQAHHANTAEAAASLRTKAHLLLEGAAAAAAAAVRWSSAAERSATAGVNGGWYRPSRDHAAEEDALERQLSSLAQRVARLDQRAAGLGAGLDQQAAASYQSAALTEPVMDAADAMDLDSTRLEVGGLLARLVFGAVARGCCAVLRCAALCCAALRCAALCCAVVCCAGRYRSLHPPHSRSPHSTSPLQPSHNTPNPKTG